jgi:hypothetical protein
MDRVGFEPTTSAIYLVVIAVVAVEISVPLEQVYAEYYEDCWPFYACCTTYR